MRFATCANVGAFAGFRASVRIFGVNRRDKMRWAGVSRRDAGDERVWRGMRGAYLGVHVRHESGADLAGLSLADIHLLDVQLVRLSVLVRLDHLADARVDELLDALGGLVGLVGHRANGDARGGRARGAARCRAQGRGGGEGVHGAEGESHRQWSVACATTSVLVSDAPRFTFGV